MKPEHHLDDATLVSYSAGALPEALAVVVAAHLELCSDCRTRLRTADNIGGLLMQRQDQPKPLVTGREAMLALLNREVPRSEPVQDAVNYGSDVLPSSLQPYFGERLSLLSWRVMSPGVRRVLARVDGPGSLMMFHIMPGTSLPEHGHGNSELTLVLRGAYEDSLGHFGPGDIADLDAETEHQPVASGKQACICVAATDAPLTFTGWLPRLLQPFFRL